jgi:heat shock protein HslJ
MKRMLVIVIVALALLASGCSNSPKSLRGGETVHTSQNALDWEGVYRGIIPCADCQGIETVVVLKTDQTFVLHTKYLGKSDEIFTSSGRFTWNSAGNTVKLEGDAQYLVGEGALTRLAQNGEPITGEQAQRYVLTRVSEENVTERYWKLVELNGKPLPESAREPWFILSVTDKRISGFGGCNRFTGFYTLDETASRLSFSQIASTQMACIAGEDVERAFHEMLMNVDNYSLTGNKLTLNRARMAPLARFEAVYLR